MNRNELAQRAHKNAVEKGFWDEPRSTEHYLMMIVVEISEAVEADRKNYYFVKAVFEDVFKANYKEKDAFEHCYAMYINPTVESELADAYIMLLSLAEREKMDINDLPRLCEEFTIVPSKDFTKSAFDLTKQLCGNDTEYKILYSLSFLESWAKLLKIDLKWHVEMKMKYNETRPRMHGKKY
jgi:hypothetical protein